MQKQGSPAGPGIVFPPAVWYNKQKVLKRGVAFMNYMKILLMYMAAVFSLSVQSTAAPVETPVPTPSAVQVQAEETPAAADSTVVITPEPEATPTPRPVPEITPNKKYRNLQRKAKGKEVEALQKRLIELGYLPAGSADGNYGNQTYKAVREFQRNNGLEADGIAGRRTQTYLFENPDINPKPTPAPTPAPADTSAPTAVPAGTPAVTETPVPEATPEDIPSAVPEKKVTPAPETTETPTEIPTEIPTEAPTEAPTPDRTAGAPVTSAPATAAPVAQNTLSVEEIDPDALQFTDAPGSIAYNDTEGPLSWTETENGVQTQRRPRLQKMEGKIRVSLDDLAMCISRWTLTEDGSNVILEAEGRTLALMNEDAGIAATVNGTEVPVDTEDFDFGEGHFISPEFLAKALGGEAVWREDVNTLTLTIPEAD